MGNDLGKFKISGPGFLKTSLTDEFRFLRRGKLEIFRQSDRFRTCRFAFTAKDAIAIVE